MALELKVRRVVTKEVVNRYQKASKQEILTNQHSGCQNLKEKGQILDDFVAIIGPVRLWKRLRPRLDASNGATGLLHAKLTTARASPLAARRGLLPCAVLSQHRLCLLGRRRSHQQATAPTDQAPQAQRPLSARE